MERLEKELSSVEPPKTPQMSHIQNGSVVPGPRSETFNAQNERKDGGAKREPVKFAPGGIELVPQPSSMPQDPLVCSFSTTRSRYMLTKDTELDKVKERMYLRLAHLRCGTPLHHENDVRHSQRGNCNGTQCFVWSSSSAYRCTIYLWRFIWVDGSYPESKFWKEGTLSIERGHHVARRSVEYAYPEQLWSIYGQPDTSRYGVGHI